MGNQQLHCKMILKLRYMYDDKDSQRGWKKQAVENGNTTTKSIILYKFREQERGGCKWSVTTDIPDQKKKNVVNNKLPSVQTQKEK